MDNTQINNILTENGIINYKIFDNANRGWYNLCYIDSDWKGVWVYIENINHLKNYLQSLTTTKD